MASSFLRLAALAGAAGLAAFAARGHAQPAPALPITVVAESTTIDRGANTYSFRGLRIEQDDYTIEARRAVASGPDAAAGEWRFDFEGGVRLQVGSAVLRAEQARFRFAGSELLNGELAGEPAEFEDLSPTGEGPVRGTADRIELDQSAGALRMEGNTSFVLGPNRIQDCDLAYDLNRERVDSGPENGDPCTITIIPPAGRDESDDETDTRP